MTDMMLEILTSMQEMPWEKMFVMGIVARVFTLACADEHLLRNLESLVAVRLNKKVN